MQPQDWKHRLGDARVERRHSRNYWDRPWHELPFKGLRLIWSEKVISALAHTLFTVAGLRKRGIKNALNVQVTEHLLPVPHLPASFEGLRVLQLSDLHLDTLPEIVPVIKNRLADVEADVCVVTGDIASNHRKAHALGLLDAIAPVIPRPAYAVLGNHDRGEMVPHLEGLGIRVLLNEATCLERRGERLWIGGVDDASHFGTHDFDAVRRAVPANEACILLSHTPLTYAEAEALGFRVMLSGHTHGGQICLPGQRAVVKVKCPPGVLAGPWAFGGLRGYTSRGTGSCGIPMRFHCPPEITVHTLVAG